MLTLQEGIGLRGFVYSYALPALAQRDSYFCFVAMVVCALGRQLRDAFPVAWDGQVTAMDDEQSMRGCCLHWMTN